MTHVLHMFLAIASGAGTRRDERLLAVSGARLDATGRSG
jgi:hypothetical protein